jgi:DNA end-binding protein Ku
MKPESFRARNLRRHAENAFENLRHYAERIGIRDPDESADRAARQIHGLEGSEEPLLRGARRAKKAPASASAKASSAPPPAPAEAEEPATVPHRLEDRTREQLYDRAKELDIPGRSAMSKEELITAIRDAQ